MDLAGLLADIPTIHRFGEESGRSPRLDTPTLRFLDRELRPGMRTLETGAGVSTILFAIKGARHTCIVPDQVQIDRVRSYCERKGVPLDAVSFVVERSDVALPQQEGELDLALIDGGHGFPIPFLDWYYIAGRLPAGGVLLIDDLHIWTCDTLVEYLRRDPEWAVVWETSRAAAVRRTVAGRHQKEWEIQPYVLSRSRATSLPAKLAYALRLARSGNLRLLADNIGARLRRR